MSERGGPFPRSRRDRRPRITAVGEAAYESVVLNHPPGGPDGIGLEVADFSYLHREGDMWGEDKDYPRAEWQLQVANGVANLGYWEWVQNERDKSGL